MSNPAVIKLIRREINGHKVWLDDNIGESVHIHIDNFRIDLSIDEFHRLCSDIRSTVNELVDVPDFDCSKIDPVFMEFTLWRKLMKLRSIEIINVQLKDLFVYVNKKYERLPDSFGVKVLSGKIRSSRDRPSNHIGQTDQQRFEDMLKSIQENGYPYRDSYIYIYENNVIYDGIHRASALYNLYGNIEIPVMCLYFDPSVPIPPVKQSYFFRELKLLRRKLTRGRKGTLKEIYSCLKSAKSYLRSFLKSRGMKKYLRSYSKEVAEINEIFSRK